MSNYWQVIVRCLFLSTSGYIAASAAASKSKLECVVAAVMFLGSVIWELLERQRLVQISSQKVHLNIATKTETK